MVNYEVSTVPSSTIRLLSWNIQGLVNNVISDDLFNQIINNNDIIVLTETWLSHHIEICGSDFYNYHNLRPLHAKARRASGGISILIRHHLRGKPRNKGANIVKESECFVWLKLDKNILNITNNIFICAVYIPPEDSTYWNKQHDFDPFQILEQDIITFQEQGDVILIGDFNARTANKLDYLNDFSEMDNITNIVRSSENTLLDR